MRLNSLTASESNWTRTNYLFPPTFFSPCKAIIYRRNIVNGLNTSGETPWSGPLPAEHLSYLQHALKRTSGCGTSTGPKSCCASLCPTWPALPWTSWLTDTVSSAVGTVITGEWRICSHFNVMNQKWTQVLSIPLTSCAFCHSSRHFQPHHTFFKMYWCIFLCILLSCSLERR